MAAPTPNPALALLLSRLAAPVTLVDVGARWGALGQWEGLGERARVVGFEPDPVECARLAAGAPSHVRYLPVGLADTEGPRMLHVTRDPGCSSIFPPVPALVEHYPGVAQHQTLVRTTPIHCRRMDDVLAEEGIGPVHAIKLDTQGSELAILKGAPRALGTCALVDVEVEFNPLYEGQDLFCDVDRFLRDRGFALWRINDLVHYSTSVVPAAYSTLAVAVSPPGNSRTVVTIPNGQVFWAQAQYVRATYPRTGAERMEAAEALPAAAIAGAHGFWDLALELVRKTGDDAMLAALEEALRPPPPEPPPARRGGRLRALLRRFDRRARHALRGRGGR